MKVALVMVLALALPPIGVQSNINEHRESVVRLGPCLKERAQAHADHLARTEEFYHSDMSRLLRACGGHWVGQIMARGTELEPARAVELWLDSPSHEAVMLSPRARRMGVGKAVDESGRTYYVVNFKGQ